MIIESVYPWACVHTRWEVLQKLQIISLFNQQPLKPPRFLWNSPGWGYLDINVFVPSQNGSSPSEPPRIHCVRHKTASPEPGSLWKCRVWSFLCLWPSAWRWAFPRMWGRGNSPPLQALWGLQVKTQKRSVLLASSSDALHLAQHKQAESLVIWARCLQNPDLPVCCLTSRESMCS